MNYSRHKKNKERNNRINFITAVVFLMMIACVYKLYKLQISEHDYFSAVASEQHQVYNELSPERGRISIKTREGGLYSLATNKDFALVYAIPKNVEEPEELAEKLYTFFDRSKVKKEAEEYYEERDQKELKSRLDKIPRDVSQEEKRTRAEEIRDDVESKNKNAAEQERREERIKERVEIKKGEIIDEYVEILSKDDDPYEPLKKKLEKEELKKMYDFLWPEDREKNFDHEDLFLENGRVYYKHEGEKKRVELEGISHVIKEYRYYPEEETASHLLGFVSSGGSGSGNYGLEGFFDKQLSGKHGFIRSGKEKESETITINDKEYKKAEDGNDLVLTIDRAVQFYVCRKLEEALERHSAESGSVVVLDPSSGGVMAMCSSPGFDPNKYEQVENVKNFNNEAIFGDYEPGSVFKTITMAAALDDGSVTPDTTYEDKGKMEIDDWTIKNSDFSTHGPYGIVDMNDFLAHSLNTGAIFAMKQTGSDAFGKYVRKFGFGEKTGIELEGESRGDLKNLDRKNIPEIYAATASYGQGITVTPLQLAAAYAAIANEGVLMKPYIVDKVSSSDGESEDTDPVRIRRVISERASALVSGMLVNVVEGGHAEDAGVEGYYVGGKTGTAQVASQEGGYGEETIHTFAGLAPVDEPRFAMVVRLDDPRDVKYAASSAAPLFGELAEFILSYYQIPKQR